MGNLTCASSQQDSGDQDWVRMEINRMAFVPMGTHQVSVMTGHASWSPLVLCQGRSRQKFQLVSLAKSLSFRKALIFFWGIRDSQAGHPYEECGLSTSTGCSQDVLWFQKNSPLFGWILHGNHFIIIRRCFLSAHRFWPMSILLCVWALGGPSVMLHLPSHGFTEVLDHYEREFFLRPLVSICRTFIQMPSSKTQAWPCSHWWSCFLHLSP